MYRPGGVKNPGWRADIEQGAYALIGGGVDMATSSILESVRLTSPKAASMFVDALEESANMPRKSPSEYKYHVEKNPEAIRRFVSKNLPKGNKHK